jgi:hypothetical protein
MPFECKLQNVISQCRNSIFYAKIDDNGIRWGNMG